MSALAHSMPAAACDCALTEISEWLPPNDSAGIPTNVQPTLFDPDYFSGCGPRITRESDHREIPAVLMSMGHGTEGLQQLVPEAPLEPRTQYRIERIGCEEDPESTSTFTTGSDQDFTPPEGGDLDALFVVRPPRRITCTDVPDVRIVVTESSDADVAYYEARVRRGDRFQGVEFLYAPTPDIQIGAATGSPSGECRFGLDDLERGETIAVETRAVDLSGNAGEWSAMQELYIPRCETIPGSLGRSLLSTLCIGALVAIGRRRGIGGAAEKLQRGR